VLGVLGVLRVLGVLGVLTVLGCDVHGGAHCFTHEDALGHRLRSALEAWRTSRFSNPSWSSTLSMKPLAGTVPFVVVDDRFLVTCPYCGEEIEIYLESDVKGTLVQDCEVCCNPWRLRVSGRRDERTIDVRRADGSE
jgi:hypothetical protein